MTLMNKRWYTKSDADAKAAELSAGAWHGLTYSVTDHGTHWLISAD